MTTSCPAMFHHQTLTKSISMVTISHRDIDGECLLVLVISVFLLLLLFSFCFFIFYILSSCSPPVVLKSYVLFNLCNKILFLLSFSSWYTPSIPLASGFLRSKRRISFSLSISPLLPKNRHFFSIGSSSSDEEEGGSKYDECSCSPVFPLSVW